ncbi:GAF and ANTAR domain-containing protein [Pseudonocardia sp. Cha107L01]|uniref:GAF and ANTAR domain-containing protein n=1 Tax=Pseudonocardia sp. Cha107L01 TaxID=3457576 RepID=UPI00403E444A
MAYSDDIAGLADRIQAQLGEGPCFDAARDHRPGHRVDDLAASQPRWSAFVPRARELGIGSMMAFLLYSYDDDDLGVLNVYSSRANVFTDQAEHAGWLLASHAVVALSAVQQENDLEDSPVSRSRIGQATGIVMERYRLAQRDALALIKKVSQNTDVKVRDLAETIAETGQVPG